MAVNTSTSVKQFKDIFFDRDKVARAVDRALRRTLSRFGAFVRTRSRSSIRTRKKVSEPGSPPSSHTGLLKRFIYFGYEPTTKTVVIGPALLNGTRSNAGLTQPETLERGGAVTVAGPRGRPRTATYRPRPFMMPAFEAERSKFLESLKDSVRG